MLSKVIKIVSNLLTVIIVILAIIFVAPRVLGNTPTAVLSGSMEPLYPVGSLIFVQKVEPATLKEGDIITFSMGDGNTAVTHRIIDVNQEEKTFQTKGDANNVEDGSPVTYSRIVGKASTFAIPFLGYISVYMNSPLGYVIIGIVILLMVITSFVDDKSKQKGGGHREKAKT